MNIQVKRFNIYSCLAITSLNTQLCFDPAKIRKEDIDSICPDFIFISHESMDHMDPAQVYILQKKKNCNVFCSVAAAIDLMQAFPYDYEFINSINTLIPGACIKFKNIIIETVKSVHCDYMLPLVFKVTFTDTNTSILHCFDTLLSDDIVECSKNTSLSIIPIGIAKGVSVNSGIEFISKLHSDKFLTNHFKSSQELFELKELVGNNSNCTFLDWNDQALIELNEVKINARLQDNSLEQILQNLSSLSNDDLMWILSNMNSIRCEIMESDFLLDSLFEKYRSSDTEGKTILLVLFILIAILDSQLIQDFLVEDIKNDLMLNVSNENNSLNTVILLFLGVYAQQSARVNAVERAMSLVDQEKEHLTYWIVEFLGRCIVANKEQSKVLIGKLIKVIKVPEIYNSVVVRRKIFWELYRIMKVIPSSTKQFLDVFEDGLTDSNPDVELLATLCFGLANRVQKLTDTQLGKIFDLLKDPEDDVRETAVKIIRGLNDKKYIIENKDKLIELVNDQNCHVRNEALITQNFISEIQA